MSDKLHRWASANRDVWLSIARGKPIPSGLPPEVEEELEDWQREERRCYEWERLPLIVLAGLR